MNLPLTPNPTVIDESETVTVLMTALRDKQREVDGWMEVVKAQNKELERLNGEVFDLKTAPDGGGEDDD